MLTVYFLESIIKYKQVFHLKKQNGNGGHEE